MKPLLAYVVVFAGLATAANAADCSNYPYSDGMNVETIGGKGIKIIATAAVGVSTDDVDVVNDARDEATLSAKAKIAHFMVEDIKSDDQISKAINDTKSMQGADKQVARQETVQRLKTISSSAHHLLRGVVPLGDCYTPNREFRVSVGVKPETLAGAGALGQAMQPSGSTGTADRNAAPGAPSPGTPAGSPGSLVPVPGYSNSDGVNKF